MATMQRTMRQVMDNKTGMAQEGDGSNCPMPTQDITLNLKNRAKAITSAAYGPENPKLPNSAFWQKKSDQWDVSIEDSKKSLCGNCSAFNVSDKIKQCIAQGIGMEADPWGTIKLADLGYCEIFDFKCAASRTCDAWVVGGPNTGEDDGQDDQDMADSEDESPDSLITINLHKMD
jgi:hypothetical protein